MCSSNVFAIYSLPHNGDRLEFIHGYIVNSLSPSLYLQHKLHLKILHGICIHATNFIRETCSSHERGGIDSGLHQIFDC